MARIICFGEVLWDVFPTHKKIGGAPLNVAVRLKSQGNDVYIISRIGNDIKGQSLLDFVSKNDITTDFIQVDSLFKTGKVKVILNSKGSASYDIMYPRSWDKIEVTEEAINLIKSSDAFVYGSLVTRDDISRASLYEFLKYAKYKIFDVNLREPYYNKEVLIHLMYEADFIKFNDDELYAISEFLGSKYHSLEQNIQFISEKTNTKSICVTKGRHGAVLLYNSKLYYNSGYQIIVVDTVGAGDSFLASLTSELLNDIDPQTAIDFACAAGALVAKSEGANPKITRLDIDKFVNPYS